MKGNDKVIFEGIIKVLKILSKSSVECLNIGEQAAFKKVIDIIIDMEKHSKGLKG